MAPISIATKRIELQNLKLNSLLEYHNFSIDSKSIEDEVIQSRSMSDPPLSEFDFKNKMAWVWTTLKYDFFRCCFIETYIETCCF